MSDPRMGSSLLLLISLLPACASIWGFESLSTSDPGSGGGGGHGGDGGDGGGTPAVVCSSIGECRAPCVECNTCVDLTSHSGNCGACGVACAAGRVCEQSECVCPFGTALCDAACVDILLDPMRCGSCDNACEGNGTCVQGACTMPELVATDDIPLAALRDLTVYNDHLYWLARLEAGGMELHGVPPDGGTVTSVMPLTEATDLRSLIIQDDTVYFAGYPSSLPGIHSIPLAGGALTTITEDIATAFVIHGGSAYWVSEALGGIVSAPVSGTEEPTLILVPTRLNDALAVDDEWIYFTQSEGTFATAHDGSTQMLVTNLADSDIVNQMKLVEDALFLGSLPMIVPLDGGEVWRGGGGGTDLDADENGFYTMNASLLYHQVPEDDESVAIAAQSDPEGSLALTPSHVYWSDGTQDIWRLAR